MKLPAARQQPTAVKLRLLPAFIFLLTFLAGFSAYKNVILF
jgi:hypothetical protein